MRYVLCAAGAAGAYYLAPWVWDQIAIRAIGSQHQGALVVGIGAWLGALVGEWMASKERR